MLNTFVSSQAARFGVARLGVASVSVVAHAGIITFAAVASGRPSALFDASRHAIPAERLLFVQPRDYDRRVASVRNGALARAAKRAVRLIVPDLTKLRAVVDASFTTLPKIPDTLTDFDLTARVSDAHDFGDIDTSVLLRGGAMGAFAPPGQYGAYTADIVEKTVWPQRDNPRPRYPETLQRQGVEGSFLVQFVVDSTGRVDAKTLAFPSSAHPMFLRAVRDALLHSRFFPAELAGMHVRQLVQQQFSFVIVR
jgi:TonB family protein